MPALTMAVILSATNVRLVRTTMLETLSAQYIMVGAQQRPARTGGAVQACPAQLLDPPDPSIPGLQFGGLIGGIVVIEKVFNWPGIGSLAFDAIAARDYPVLQGAVTVLALVIILVNLLVDIAYGIVDPRIRIR